ncbi:nucleic acid-binding protein [Choiromyces venosus 120613-1]|uniref:rRNA biogenesis protein RRP5 n=1 Tax=Choiromyces venosus 120613-1 TaxID=1336337 RepID=A0A3N4IYH1_9PEZI|nr:nucleic acid-binding protein [Choiromyces venosus 120613-1]
MGSDKKRKRPQDADPSPAKKGEAKKSPATANKRLKPEASAAASKPEPAKPSTLRVSKDEETSFPRGGGSILTPLEFKQISNDAAKDALFETENAKVKTTKKPKREELKKGKKSKKDESKKGEKKGIVAEGLSYKRLLSGTLVLGCISQINRTDLALSLPNNLTGFVPLISISELLNKKLEALVQDSDEEEDEDGKEKTETAKSESSEDDVDLKSMFRIGQYLRAYVVSSSQPANPKSSSSSKKMKKRIELSLDPVMVNNGLTTTELVAGCTVQASVTSVEDHGLVMDLGIGNDLKGFLSSKELGKGRSVADAKEGQVMLCTITGLSSNGRIVKLSADLEQKPTKKGKYTGGKAAWWLSSAPTISTFLPGTGVEVLITDIARGGKSVGIAGKVMGLVDAVIDFFHASGWGEKDIESRFKVGEKIKARVIATYSEPRKLALSILPHVLSFAQPIENEPTAILPTATIVDSAKVLNIEPKTGLFLDVGVPGVPGFVHISRISSDSKIEVLSKDSGPYQIDSAHKARIIGYNSMDGLYLVSMEQKILDQPFLRVEDIKIGEIVKGTIERVLDGGAVIVNLAEGITGMVDDIHLSDIKLKNPEKKFREGVEVKARVLSTDPSKRRVRLTLKKAIVNSDAPIISSYEDTTSGTQSVGTLIKILPNGAIVKFFSDVFGFLPVSEMSEAFIQDPREHFTIGQSVNVHVLSVDPANQKLRVSCRDPNLFGEAQKEALAKLSPGDVVFGTVVEKSADDLFVEINGLGADGIRAVLIIGHLTDGSREKSLSVFKKLRAGQKLEDLLVLDKHEERRSIILSMKPSLVKAAKGGSMISKFEDVNEGQTVKGWVKGTTLHSIFVGFVGGIVGLVSKKDLPAEVQSLPNFGYVKNQSIAGRVVYINPTERRFRLSLNPEKSEEKASAVANTTGDSERNTVNPVDSRFELIDDYTPGKLTKAKVVSVQETQLNVKLADNVQGRIDISLVFDSWGAIKNKKSPLASFKKGNVLDVKVIGIHDARNHRFLPITHRKSNTKIPIFELSARPSHVKEEGIEGCVTKLEDITPNSTWVTFVNNISEDCAWANIMPDIRGRIRILDLSDDVTQLKTLQKSFPIGCALKCQVLRIDLEHNKLDLSARSASGSALAFDKLAKGMVVPGRVTKVTDRQVLVQISESVSGPVGLTDIADDFSQARTDKYTKNEMIRVCIIDIDPSNKRVTLSTRPSRVMSSDLPVKDPEIQTIVNVKVGDIRRGFVKQASPKGLFVTIGGNVTAWVKISDLSDKFLKDWKNLFTVGQLVKGKIMAVDSTLGHIQMSLRESDISGKARPKPADYSSLKKGQIVKGKVRNVAEYGIFISVDGSENISGLCHKSQIADNAIEDISKLYAIGDPVKAKIMSIDPEKKRISFGLKASYFKDEGSEDENEDEDEDESEDDSEEGGVDLSAVKDFESDASEDSDEEGNESDVEMTDAPAGEGLSTGGFDWSASILDKRGPDTDSGKDSDSEEEKHKKKKRKKAQIKEDLTGNLATREPQSVADFERLLLGDPNDSKLWIMYMSFQLQLSEVEKAREIAERAVKTIALREEKEKQNVWIAMLNMESMYGTDESLEEVFKRACQYNEAQDIHEKLASICIQTGKSEKADDLFKVMIKKFSQDPKIWVNYADFLLSSKQNREAARALLQRAMQALPQDQHKDLISKFAKLEFRSGDPERGRTLFENLLATFKKKSDLYNLFLDMEIKYGSEEDDGKEGVRALFKRALAEKPSTRQAKALFKKWLEFEKSKGDEKSVETVTRKAKEYVEAKKGE